LGQTVPKALTQIQPGKHEIELMPTTLSLGTSEPQSKAPETASRVSLTPRTTYTQIPVNIEKRPKSNLQANLNKIATNKQNEMETDPPLSPKNKNKSKKKKPSNPPPSR